MIFPSVPDRALLELGRTEGGPDTLALLIRDQDTRRMLMLRAVLDAADGADPSVCSAAGLRRLREDWALLEEADRVASAVGGTAGYGTAGYGSARDGAGGGEASAGTPRTTDRDTAASSSHSPVRARLLHPLVGPWARRCLRGLDAGAGPGTEPQARELRHDLAYFSAVAAMAAARSGLSFAVPLRAADGALTLPSLGTLRTAAPGDVRVDVVHRRGRLTLRQAGAADTVVHLESGVGAWSPAPAWTPAYALPGLLPGAAPVPLDDLDPYRVVRGGPRHRRLGGPVTLDDTERKLWLQSWSGTAAVLRLGGEQRVAEAVALLRCLVPLRMPLGARAGGSETGSCSGTRREAFGAVLSSTPPTPGAFAATLVHELHHTKLAALSDMVTLHRASPQERYFAPWRPDPRPYDGLLQGAYSHLALADFFHRRALAGAQPADEDSVWGRFARHHEQAGAVLPTLVGSPDLTPRGRRFVDQMVAVYERMAEHPAPRGHTARAQAYVSAARVLWTQRNASVAPPPNEAGRGPTG